MAPPTATAPTSTATPATSGSRSRPQARKKPNDDAAYFGPVQGTAGGGAGSKRQAAERIEGEPRQKRKRIEGNGMSGNGLVRKGERGVDSGEGKESLVKFSKMPMAALYRYLTHFDIVPIVYPSPLSSDDPPPPSSLEQRGRQQSLSPSLTATTPANRPRRESKEQSRRRSSRLVEEEIQGRTPVLADIDEVHQILAGIAERHFVEQGRREEVDILASFMCKVKSASP